MISSKDIISTITITIFLIATTYLASLLAPVPFTVSYFSGNFSGSFIRETITDYNIDYSITTITSVSEANHFLREYEGSTAFPTVPGVLKSDTLFDEALIRYDDNFFEENILVVLLLEGFGQHYFVDRINYTGTMNIIRNLEISLIAVVKDSSVIVVIELDRSMLSTNFRTRFTDVNRREWLKLLAELSN